MWILAAAAVGLRCYSMRWKHVSFTASEWLILSAFVFGTGLTIMEIYGLASHPACLFLTSLNMLIKRRCCHYRSCLPIRRDPS